MAIQVTGLFQNPDSGLIYQSPMLILIPHLEYKGILNLDVQISNYNGSIAYSNINTDLLTYDIEITNPYIQLIRSLELYIIEDLKQKNEYNSQATFTTI